MLHHVAEQAVRDRMRTAKTLLGFRYKDVVFTEDLLWMADTALDAFHNLADGFRDFQFVLEQSVAFVPVPGAFGTADGLGAGLYEGKRTGLCLDWKFGGREVPAKNNLQAAFYLAAATIDPRTRHIFEGCEQYMIAIVQPKAKPEADVWITTPLWLDLYKSNLIAAHKRSQAPNPPRKAGSWCSWCKAAPDCPAVVTQIGNATKKDPATMDPIALSTAMDLVSDFGWWAKKVTTAAHDHLRSGGTLPGYKEVAKRANRQWVPGVNADTLIFDFGIDPHAPQNIVSPAEAERRVKADYADRPKAKRTRLERISEVVVRPDTGTVIAPETDKRPAVTATPEQTKARSILAKMVKP